MADANLTSKFITANATVWEVAQLMQLDPDRVRRLLGQLRSVPRDVIAKK